MVGAGIEFPVCARGRLPTALKKMATITSIFERCKRRPTAGRMCLRSHSW